MKYFWMIVILLQNHTLVAHKDGLNFDDGDLERLFQQWEENDDEVEPDERHQDTNVLNEAIKEMDPQSILKLSKKGKPLMMFVGVRGTPDQTYTEQVSGRWMQSLQNAHLTVQRYIVAPDRVLFMVEDGSLAWDIKNYLTSLTECTTVSFEQLSFDCKDDKKKEL